MALSWPLIFLSSTRPLSTAPPSIRSHLLTRHHLPTISATALSTSQLSLPDKFHPFITTPTKPHDRVLKITAAHFNISFPPLISPHDHWRIWTSLFIAGAFGLWPEKTKVRSALSGALVSTLVALATTNLSIIASEVPVYSDVLEYLLPIAIHLLLFRADLRRILQSIGALLLVFLLGSAAELYDFDDEKGASDSHRSLSK
ncbi:uncharacterized protein LOC131255781 isoform X3 [Magnolia sinica]|uniref:uncharacterized protein LOC131255781 isoform X3 n=1 Tax=Magnolia sinica TaxID=86752 RepID=UPI002659A1DB|nr:uncharacterized protein LOC131255781 isoform X3 [Magnolia sinica]